MDVNTQIANRRFFTGFCERTYYTQELYDSWVDNYDDPDILFKIKIKGKYQKMYKWTEAQAEQFIADNLEDSRGYTVNGEWYAYDWGVGENKVTRDKMHEPNLDHVLPRERGGADTPDNMRIRSRRLNENKGNTNTDQERWATVIDMIADFDSEEERRNLLSMLQELYS
jgi:hypothetical protein